MRRNLRYAVLVCLLAFLAIGFAYVSPKLFETAAPTGARIMKFAVQRARGVAVAAGVLLVVSYIGIAAAGWWQDRADRLQETDAV